MYDIDRKANKMKADIFVMRADGSDLKKITGDEKNDFYTSWAKGRIAFSSGNAGARESDIYTANPDGSGAKKITK